jgi:hypothetical protein
VLLFSIVFTTVRPLAAAPYFAGFVVTAMVPLLGFLIRDKAITVKGTDNKNGE